VEATREKNLATRKQIITGVSEHPDLREEQLAHPKPDRSRLRVEASARLMAWRRDHASGAALAGLTHVVAEAPRTLGALTEAAVQAAEAGATLGQMNTALIAARGGAQAPTSRHWPFTPTPPPSRNCAMPVTGTRPEPGSGHRCSWPIWASRRTSLRGRHTR